MVLLVFLFSDGDEGENNPLGFSVRFQPSACVRYPLAVNPVSVSPQVWGMWVFSELSRGNDVDLLDYPPLHLKGVMPRAQSRDTDHGTSFHVAVEVLP